MWVEDVFHTAKPIIGMCHLKAMPGDPYYDKAGGMKKVFEAARSDLAALQNGGVDAVMFSNEFSLPYLTKVRPTTLAAMADIIGELKRETKVPFGINVLWDPIASLDVAVAVGAKFVREIFTGVYASDFGLWNTNCGETVRHKMSIGADDVKLLFNIVPESAKYLAERDIREIARSTVFNNKPDALCVSGLIAGEPTDIQLLSLVKSAVPNSIVFSNTGVRKENVCEQLAIVDGAVVGTTFKGDGIFENSVDEARVRSFMEVVTKFRSHLG
jgi:membrane complex biogenesis BtpA family protein